MTSSFSDFSGPQTPVEHRGRVVKMALVYVPIALVSLAISCVAIYNIAIGNTGFLFMLTIFGLVGLLTGYQGWQYVKDLKALPMDFQGEIIRKWHKGNLFFFFMPSYYIMVDSRVQSGSVSRVEENGAFVRMHSGAEGFVPRKELDIDKPARSAQDMVSPGDKVKYKVRGMNQHGLYKLSCRRAEERSVVGKIFTVSRIEYAMLLEQDEVRVTCYPHSATVERLERYDESEKGFVPATHGATF
jgi:predicted RNA-binding protein with RPS1 domain